MDDDTGICGRDKEIKDIYNFIVSRVESKRSGVLYLTGPPGTGKSMSVQFVLDKLKEINVVSLNCLQAQSSKVILGKICRSVGLSQFARRDESTMVASLTKKFTGRTCETQLIVLDEMDRLPKSKNKDLIKKIFSWPSLPSSKLILIGIANTINLTSKYEIISEIIGRDLNHITKIIFKPYSSKDIKNILQWYLDNDENFEDASLEPRVLDLISAKFARDKNGDIRSALNALKSTIDDSIKQPVETPVAISCYLTPPATPPSTPCKERTNCSSVADSIRKRQRTTHYKDDSIPHSHEVIMTCIIKLCSGTTNSSIDLKTCRNLIVKVSGKYGLSSSFDDIRSMLDNLVMQGLIEVKKGRPFEKIVLKSSENELTNLIKRKNMIMDLINTLI